VSLIIGQRYTLVASLPGFDYPSAGEYSNLAVAYAGTAVSVYSGGRFYFVGDSYPDDFDPFFATRDLAFQVTPVSVGGGVPEPASWALMILGFGAAGASLRRRVTGRPAADAT